MDSLKQTLGVSIVLDPAPAAQFAASAMYAIQPVSVVTPTPVRLGLGNDDAFSASWTSGPIAGRPHEAQLNEAGITSFCPSSLTFI